MRKKSPQGGGYSSNQRHKPRFSGGGSGGQGGGNRPRKNYSAMREKYLQQARDALAAGDRVLAENYFQHAEHCFRMIAEENASRPQPRPQTPQEQQATENTGNEDSAEEEMPMNNSALPAFLKASYEGATTSAEPAPVQDWEERDAS